MTENQATSTEQSTKFVKRKPKKVVQSFDMDDWEDEVGLRKFIADNIKDIQTRQRDSGQNVVFSKSMDKETKLQTFELQFGHVQKVLKNDGHTEKRVVFDGNDFLRVTYDPSRRFPKKQKVDKEKDDNTKKGKMVKKFHNENVSKRSN